MDKIIDFLQVKTIRSLGRNIMNGAITLNDAKQKKIHLKFAIHNFSSSTRPKNQKIKRKRS